MAAKEKQASLQARYTKQRETTIEKMTLNGVVVSEGTSLFTAPKHCRFRDPELSLRREGNVLIITAKTYAKQVAVEGVDGV